jgi:hypothetical protein
MHAGGPRPRGSARLDRITYPHRTKISGCGCNSRRSAEQDDLHLDGSRSSNSGSPARSFRDEDLLVELRGFEPLASCMPYKSLSSRDEAGCGSTRSFNRCTSPVVARDRRSLAPRLAPRHLRCTVPRNDRLASAVDQPGPDCPIPRTTSICTRSSAAFRSRRSVVRSGRSSSSAS